MEKSRGMMCVLEGRDQTQMDPCGPNKSISLSCMPHTSSLQRQPDGGLSPPPCLRWLRACQSCVSCSNSAAHSLTISHDHYHPARRRLTQPSFVWGLQSCSFTLRWIMAEGDSKDAILPSVGSLPELQEWYLGKR